MVAEVATVVDVAEEAEDETKTKETSAPFKVNMKKRAMKLLLRTPQVTGAGAMDAALAVEPTDKEVVNDSLGHWHYYCCWCCPPLLHIINNKRSKSVRQSEKFQSFQSVTLDAQNPETSVISRTTRRRVILPAMNLIRMRTLVVPVQTGALWN